MLRQKEKLVILQRIDNITLILDRLNEIINEKEDLIEQEEMLKNKAKEYLQSKKWDRYLDETNKMSITITSRDEESIDLKQLKFLVDRQDLNQITHITKTDIIEVITPNMRDRLKTMARGG